MTCLLPCDRCGVGFNPVATPGALMFSPMESGGAVTKYHVCPSCWVEVVEFLAVPERVEMCASCGVEPVHAMLRCVGCALTDRPISASMLRG